LDQRPAHAAVARALRRKGTTVVRSAARAAVETAGAGGDGGEGIRSLPEKYFDLNVQHFHEKLQAEHGIELSYTWVKQALQGAGLVRAVASAGCIANGGAAAVAGMLLHIDGSRHQCCKTNAGTTDRDSGRRHQRDLLRQLVKRNRRRR